MALPDLPVPGIWPKGINLKPDHMDSVRIFDKRKGLLTDNLVVNSFSERFFSLTDAERSRLKQEYPWHMVLQWDSDHADGRIDDLRIELKLNDDIEEMLYNGISPYANVYRLFSLMGTDYVQHHWFLDRPLGGVLETGIPAFAEIDCLRPLSCQVAEDLNWTSVDPVVHYLTRNTLSHGYIA